MKKVLDAILDWPEKAFYALCLLLYRAVLISMIAGGTALAWMLHPIAVIIAFPILLIGLGVQWTPSGWPQESRHE